MLITTDTPIRFIMPGIALHDHTWMMNHGPPGQHLFFRSLRTSITGFRDENN